MDKEIANLMYYASAHLLLDSYNEIYIRNKILDILKIDNYIDTEPDIETIENMENPKDVLLPIVKYAMEKNLIKEEEADIFANHIMDELSLNPASIYDTFIELIQKNTEKATDWFNDYSIKNNSTKSVFNNVSWDSKDSNGNIKFEVKILGNENPFDMNIRKTYPMCVLCSQNEGSQINNRANSRFIPFDFSGEDWFFSYVAYPRVNQHFIILNKEHKKAETNKKALQKMVDFVENYPHFFIGCDVDTENAGVSNAIHENFQGGKGGLPLFRAKDKVVLKTENLMIDVSIVDWFMSTIRIKGNDKKALINLADDIFNNWKKIDEKNSVNFIIRKEKLNKTSKFVIDIVLRNATEDISAYASIKSSPLCFIDVAGIMSLPNKLIKEIKDISFCLVSQSKPDESLIKHKDMIAKISRENPGKISEVEASIIIREEINGICDNIYSLCSAFSSSLEGLNEFKAFLQKNNLN